MRKQVLLLLLVSGLAGCASIPPSSREDLCRIFAEKPSWYASSIAASRRWKAEIEVPMAIMAQESSFRARAKPPMRFFLGFIPYGRASNAYGYPQALDSTWAVYKRKAGSTFARRSNFDDAIDFIQWYMNETLKQNKVSKLDAYGQYLNYHEGQAGYRRGTYKNKSWLINTAKKVENRAQIYREQLQGCRSTLEKRRKRWKLFG